MSIEWVVDDSGTGMKLKKTSRNRYTGMMFPIDAVENLYKFPLRSDDVMICSYPKCGIHWLWENIRILLSGDINVDTVEKESSMMELKENLDHLPSPRILNNHGFFDEQPWDLRKVKAKLIFLYRNPKDVAVSYYHHHLKFPSLEYQGDFDNFLRRFVQGQVVNSSYFQYLQSFEEGLEEYSNIDFLLVRYEDLHENPIAERRRIATFLGRDHDDIFLESVREATTIDVMRTQKGPTSHKDQNGNAIMYRRGKVGDWKESFTASQNEWFDQEIDRIMGETRMFDFVFDI